MADQHILAVDDDPAMRELISGYLSGHGFRVSTAADGADMARVMTSTSSI